MRGNKLITKSVKFDPVFLEWLSNNFEEFRTTGRFSATVNKYLKIAFKYGESGTEEDFNDNLELKNFENEFLQAKKKFDDKRDLIELKLERKTKEVKA